MGTKLTRRSIASSPVFSQCTTRLAAGLVSDLEAAKSAPAFQRADSSSVSLFLPHSGDIGAGFTIINEAGGLTVGSKADTLEKIKSNSSQLGVVTPEVLQGRKYCVVRGGERSDQVGLLKEFFEAVDEWEA